MACPDGAYASTRTTYKLAAHLGLWFVRLSDRYRCLGRHAHPTSRRKWLLVAIALLSTRIAVKVRHKPSNWYAHWGIATNHLQRYCPYRSKFPCCPLQSPALEWQSVSHLWPADFGYNWH